MGKRRDAGEDLARRKASRKSLPFLLVVCEGKVTEPQYIEAFRRDHANRLVRVEINDDSGVPKTLVERAIELRDDAERRARASGDSSFAYDEVWCVFDVDAHPRLGEALQQARDNELFVALSNPCIELWLLLHFEDQTSHVERRIAARKLRKHLPEYDKHVDYSKLRNRYADALKRATALESQHTRDGVSHGNPSSGMYALTERILLVRRR